MTYHIPLNSAYLCADCSEVGGDHRRCPACASANLLPLATVLDREPLCVTVGEPYRSVPMEA